MNGRKLYLQCLIITFSCPGTLSLVDFLIVTGLFHFFSIYCVCMLDFTGVVVSFYALDPNFTVL